jgi:hypothetical protein
VRQGARRNTRAPDGDAVGKPHAGGGLIARIRSTSTANRAYARNATVYSGSVGNLEAEAFGENQYSFGIFTYVFNRGRTDQQQFEVVDYWVE